MEKTIGAVEIRRQFGKIIQEVAVKGDRFVVERHGEPIAAVVPMEVYQQWKRARQALFDQMRAVSARANVSEAKAEQLVTEAIRAVRAPSPPYESGAGHQRGGQPLPSPLGNPARLLSLVAGRCK